MPILISWAQRRRFRGPDAAHAHWSHCALVVDEAGDLVEAEARGVARSPISKYRAEEYHLVRLGDQLPDDGRRRVVAYGVGHVGDGFGYLALLSLGFWLLTGLRVRLARRDHQMCSGLVAHALQEGGQLAGHDATFTLPADLARHYGARG
jgi:hypothetical protein